MDFAKDDIKIKGTASLRLDMATSTLDYIKLNKELKLYNEELGGKPQVVALNKIDEPASKKAVTAFRKRYGRKKLFQISSLTGEGIKPFLDEVLKKCKK